MTQFKYSHHVRHPKFLTWEKFNTLKAAKAEIARLKKRYPGQEVLYTTVSI